MIEADQAMLIQFAEEKMALACQCYDLVDMHLMQIDRDIDVFESELQVCSLACSSLADICLLHCQGRKSATLFQISFQLSLMLQPCST